MDVQPFKIQVPEAVLGDLRERLARTRWPDEIPGSGWDYGSNLAYIKELVEYWRTGFDWRAQEKAMNAFTQFRATVDGLGIHFIHERGKGPTPCRSSSPTDGPKQPSRCQRSYLCLPTLPAMEGTRRPPLTW